MNASPCYNACNDSFKVTEPTMRLFCKKGCDADEEKLDECKQEFCPSLCIKEEIGSDDNKFGSWSKYFARASGGSEDCMKACYIGC